MASKNKKGSGSGGSKSNKQGRFSQSSLPQITDERFSGAINDPKFRRPKDKNVKVKLDDRFKKSDIEDFRNVEIDRYGRRLKDLGLEDDKYKDFDRYFEQEGEGSQSGSEKESESESESGSESEDEEHNKKAPVKKGKYSSDEESESEDESDAEPAKAKQSALDRARGEGLNDDGLSSDTTSDSDSDSDSDSETEDTEEELAIEEEEPETGDPTRRLALVNMDWDNLTAVDLMATFAGFAKGSGEIKSITIYPSEFGKEKMAKEEKEGPARDLFASEKKMKKSKKNDDSDSDSDSDSDLSDIDLKNKYDLNHNREKAIKALYEEDKGDEYDSKNLRKYQLQRLRYYYAIIVCDSVSVAQKIYQNCDGLEFEATANFFDLRYVPDDVDFNDDEKTDYCDHVPLNYRPKINFETSALQHSKVKLTWDETPSDRLQLASKAFSQKDIEEMDFKAYLATDSEDESDAENNDDRKSKYKQLLQNSIKIGDKNLFDEGNESGSEVDMEITFAAGLDEKQEKDKEEEETEETSIEKYKRKAKERRKARMEQIKEMKRKEKEGINGGEASNDSEDEGQKPSAKHKNKNKKKAQRNDAGESSKDVKSKAELELLMMENKGKEADKQHFDLKQIMKSEKDKKQKKKNKKNKRVADDEFLQDDFKPDLDDDRFKDVFENDEFAIDPNQPEFRKTSTMMKILEERNKRVATGDEEDGTTNEELKSKNGKKRKLDTENAVSEQSNAKKLAEKIKNKYKGVKNKNKKRK